LAKDIDLKKIKADYILLSHAHQDHILDALEIAGRCDSMIISNWEIVQWARNNGHEKVHEMNTGGSFNFDFGTLTLTPAVHSSSFPDGSYGGNPVGFIIQSGKHAIYYAGDTALTYDMKLIGERYNLDLAFLPIGSNFTMDFQDAIRAAKFINCTHIIPMHYNTFGYIVIDEQEVISNFNNHQLNLSMMKIGETMTIE
jgi:L-ascorbate metabolism protein UlaG (beta-lactamase superfamily)